MDKEQYLIAKGIKPNLKGFQFFIDAIDLCHNDASLIHNFTKENGLYHTLGKKHNITPEAIERRLRTTLRSAGLLLKVSEFIALATLETK